MAVGKIVRPWGLRGELKVESLTDFPERFDEGERLWLAGSEVTVLAVRWQKNALYLKLSGIDTVEQAESWRDYLLEVPESDLHELDDDEYYLHQLLGLRVRTGAGQDLGTVHEVMPTGSNDVLVVRGPLGEVLLPFIDDVVKDVDLSGDGITVDLIEGLLDDASAPPEGDERPARPRARGGGIDPPANTTVP